MLFISLGGFLVRYVENGVREDFGKITLKGLRVPLCRLDEEDYLEVVLGKKSVKTRARDEISLRDAEGGQVSDDLSVEVLDLSARAEHCLQRAGIASIGQLCAMNEEELFRIRNMGKKTVEEVKDKLSKLGCGLKEI